MPERPITAFALVLIGGAIILITSVLVLAEYFTGRVRVIDVLNPTIPPFIRNNIGDMEIGIIGSIFGILVIIGSILIVTGNIANIEALFFAILSLLIVAGGFYLGFLLAFVGTIMALLWKPPS
jgi:hypothetical protein